VDYGDLSVNKIDQQGNLLGFYRGKAGQGPGELQSIVDVGESGDGLLYVVDGQTPMDEYGTGFTWKNPASICAW
jgi:hypothetical protein